jgi:hypothetical protein
MIRAHRHQVVVQKGGRVEVRSPDLKPGTLADVIILEPSPPAPAAGPARRLSDLVGSCKGMFSSPREADAFLDQERDAWPR